MRATGSGAGCGDHWPLCNGDVVPLEASVKTMIEFTHRVTSGLAFLLVAFMWVWAKRKFSTWHVIPKLAFTAFMLMIVESAVGALIVLFKYVEYNDSWQRTIVTGVHLVNTLLLIGAIGLVWWEARQACGERTGLTKVKAPFVRRSMAVLVLGFLLVSASGAIVALGDTLFPAKSLLEGVKADFDPNSHFLVRLRIWHPVFAVVVSAALLIFGYFANKKVLTRQCENLFVTLSCLVFLQMALGAWNVVLLAPNYMQILHLASANALWLTVVVYFWEIRKYTQPLGFLSPSVNASLSTVQSK